MQSPMGPGPAEDSSVQYKATPGNGRTDPPHDGSSLLCNVDQCPVRPQYKRAEQFSVQGFVAAGNAKPCLEFFQSGPRTGNPVMFPTWDIEGREGFHDLEGGGGGGCSAREGHYGSAVGLERGSEPWVCEMLGHC